jgi:hypothetical protein
MGVFEEGLTHIQSHHRVRTEVVDLESQEEDDPKLCYGTNPCHDFGGSGRITERRPRLSVSDRLSLL